MIVPFHKIFLEWYLNFIIFEICFSFEGILPFLKFIVQLYLTYDIKLGFLPIGNIKQIVSSLKVEAVWCIYYSARTVLYAEFVPSKFIDLIIYFYHCNII